MRPPPPPPHTPPVQGWGWARGQSLPPLHSVLDPVSSDLFFNKPPLGASSVLQRRRLQDREYSNIPHLPGCVWLCLLVGRVPLRSSSSSPLKEQDNPKEAGDVKRGLLARLAPPGGRSLVSSERPQYGSEWKEQGRRRVIVGLRRLISTRFIAPLFIVWEMRKTWRSERSRGGSRPPPSA